MPKEIRNVTIAPKVDLDSVFARFDDNPVAKGLLVALHAGLMQLDEAPWIDDDYYEILLATWSGVTGVAFRDTLPTYTIEVDGKPLTMGMVAVSLDKLNDVRSPQTCEEILQAEPITLFGMEPEHHDD